MRSSLIGTFILVLVTVPLPALAQSWNPFAPPPPKWTATFGLQDTHAKSTAPGSPSKTDSISGTATLMYQYDDATFLGGNIAYTNSDTKAGLDNGQTDSDAYAGGVFAMRALEPTLLLDGALGFGSVALDNRYNNGAAILYNADTIFWSAGLGLTKLFPVSPNLTASLSARYTLVASRTDSYTDSANNRVNAQSSKLHYISPGGGLNWRYGQWEPYANLSWNLGSRDFTSGVSDRDYFSFGFGTGYAVTKATTINAGFAGVLGKSEASERSLLLSVTTKF